MKGLRITLREVNLGCKPLKTHLLIAEDVKGGPKGLERNTLKDSLKIKKMKVIDYNIHRVFQSK